MRDRAPTQALLLVGHGSHLSPDSAAPVYDHAARIRGLGLFDEVQEAFWKEEPALPHALEMLTSAVVYVVPVFLAEGYFTRRVVPRELGLLRPRSRFGSRRVVYCSPVGTHPRMEELILRRAVSTCGLGPDARRDAALVILGHGTERSSTSAGTVRRIVAQLRERGEFGAVACGFLDEEPRIGPVLESLRRTDVVLVPFFVADGWHSRTTIPRDLELEGLRTERGGRSIWYTPPVGTLPEIADVVLELAAEAGARIREA